MNHAIKRCALALCLVRCVVPGPGETMDSGTPPMPQEDSGTPVSDSGTPDAGGEPDSGMPVMDAGMPGIDAGTPDSGTPDSGIATPPADAGTLYDTDGTVPYTTSTQHLTNGMKSFDLTLYMPTTSGLHPLVVISSGSTQTAAAYADYGKRLASWGIAALIRDDPGALTRTVDIVPDNVYAVGTWVPANLGTQVDVTKIGLAGHSRGGAVSLITAEQLKGHVAAWFGIDPVDNQFLFDPGVFARTEVSNVGIPTAYLGASVISNCAPSADGYSMLYPLSPSPSVEIIGVGAGHTQFEPAALCSACSLCTPAGTADPAKVYAYALRYFTAFFARELLGDTRVGPRLEGAGTGAEVAAGLVTVTSK